MPARSFSREPLRSLQGVPISKKSSDEVFTLVLFINTFVFCHNARVRFVRLLHPAGECDDGGVVVFTELGERILRGNR